MHRERGLRYPTLNDDIKRAITGFKRLQGERKDTRAPVTVEIMQRLKDGLDSTTWKKYDTALLWSAFTLAWCGYPHERICFPFPESVQRQSNLKMLRRGSDA